MSQHDRRDFMRRMGVAGVTLGSVTIAGCTGGDTEPTEGEGDGGGDGDDGDGGDGDSESGTGEKRVVDNPPEERRMGEVVHVSNTERYYPERYQANVLIDEEHRERIGAPLETHPFEVTKYSSEEEKGNFDLITYNWWSAQGGDPDNVIFDRYHVNGARNYGTGNQGEEGGGGFDHEKYNEVAAKSRSETDLEKRKELVYEAQKILGEQRPENQYLYNSNINAYRSDQLSEDSMVQDGRLIASMWTWTSMEPTGEDGKVAVTNNWDPTNQINPFHHNAVGSSRNMGPTRLFHDFLVRFDPEFERQLWVAENIEWPDETTIVATISDGFEFHDGEPLTVEDVHWTYSKLLEVQSAGYQTAINTVLDSVEIVDDNNVRFDLQTTYAPFTTLSMWKVPILPKHVWTQYISDTGTEQEPWKITINDDRPIIGSGPFEYGTWQQAERFEMPANKDHPLAAPKIDKRVVRPLETREAELAALRQGEYTFMDFWFGDPQKMWDLVEKEGNGIGGYTALDNTRQACWVNPSRPPYDDVAMRQATNAIVEEMQPVIIEELYKGFGERAHSPITKLIKFWHNPDTQWFDGGTAQAIEILKDAGYVWDQDGNLYYPEGKTGKS